MGRINKSSLLTAILAAAILSPGCKKFVQIEPPPDLVVSATLFSNDQSANAAITGLYTQLNSNSNIANGATTIYTGLTADELYNTAPNANIDPFYKNALLSTTPIVKTHFWTPAYSIIYHANAILEGVRNSTNLGDSMRNRLTGEAKFIRAFFHFYLLNLFGDVPLIVTTDYRITSTLPRKATADVYNQIIADLKEARDLLPVNYATPGRVRPNKWAVASLLARVYLYLGDYANSEIEASVLLGNPAYTLEPNLNNVFLAASREAIWQLMPVSTTVNTSEGNLLIPSSATVKPVYAINPLLLNAFETNDQRKSNWLKSNTVSGQPYFYPYKYKVRTGAPPYAEHFMMLRLAEQYLVRAEARARLNKLAGAISDLNMVRVRAGLPPLANGLAQADVLAAVEKERRTELFAEWGHRWFDLKRTGGADAVLGPAKAPTWESTDALLPIPLSELDVNVFLTQNPGY